MAAVLLAVHSTGGATTLAPAAAVPVLAPWSNPYVERDMPARVQARNRQAQDALVAEARAAALLPATEANGCVPRSSQAPLGPPAPTIVPRVLGHHVEVLLRWPRLPASPACRPWLVSIALTSPTSTTNSVERFRIRGAVGRVVLHLPFYSRPPYRVFAESQSIAGHRSPTVELPLRCPKTGDAVRGCLPGSRHEAHAFLMPKPVLPVKGLDRRTLERSFGQIVADERTPPVVGSIPRRVSCRSLTVCEVTYVDPLFPRSPYGVHYRIAGQQLAGCWIGFREEIDPRPYDDAGYGRLLPAGCASWLR